MNKHLTIVLMLVSLIASGVVTIQTIKADSKTIIVPEDYPTIVDAVGNATDGDTIFVKKGTYEEHTLVINKSISLIGEDADNTILKNIDPEFRGNWPHLEWVSAIQIGANQVTISDFRVTLAGGAVISIVGTGNGIKIIRNIITSGKIDLTGSNQTLEGNNVLGTAGEFAVSCSGSYNFVSSNEVTGSIGGIYTSGSSNVVYGNNITAESGTSGGLEVNGDENIVAKNSISSFVPISGSFNIVCGNTIPNNLAIRGNNNTFYGNYLQGLVLGNRIKDASNNLFYHNNFDFVESTALPPGEKTFTIWEGVRGPDFLDNGKEGNYWNDYNGTDEDGDGIGDTPYVIYANDTSNYHYIADFNIANITLTDHYPLMVPLDISKITILLPDWASKPSPSPSTSPQPTPSPSIPEFPFGIVPLLLIATLALFVISKKRKGVNE
jgi:nitrous oxidase accessory protein